MKRKHLINFVCFFSFFLFSSSFLAQTITGKITDELGDPLFGATVQLKNAENITGVLSDEKGMYSLQAKEGSILSFSYLGHATQEITVGNNTTINVVMLMANELEEIVISSSRKAVRKIQATTAINSVGAKEMAIIQPESFTEAIQNTPGVTIDETQGRKGGFNIRGFPGGAIYTTTLIDGLPVSGTAGLSSGQQEFFGIDQNVQNIEVVRGAAATLFGRSAAAGAVNIISKIGGTTHKGSFAMTQYSNNAREGHQFEDEIDYRADFNLNGPLSDNLRYNIGGYVLEDSGVKEQFAKDRGAQLRANVDWLISETSSIRFYGSIFNNQFQNITDTPWDLKNNKVAEGWSSANTFFNDPSNLDRKFGTLGVRQGFFNTATATDANGIALTDNPGGNKELTKGMNIGIDFNIDLGQGWMLSERFRYNSFDYADINEFSFSTFYSADANVSRFNGEADNQNRDLITEHRITKQIQTATAEHNISAGIYYSTAERDRLGINFVYASSVVSRNPTIGSSFGYSTGSFGFPQPAATSYVSNTSSNRKERSTAFFIGDEMVFNEKLSVNVAFRYDWLTTSFNNDPKEIKATGIDYNPAKFEENELKFKDYSFSVGANYLLGESSAVYANYVRAFSLPGSVNLTSELPADNEVVNNLELGYRAGLGDLTLDITVFNTHIANRIATVYDGNLGEFVERPAGSNKILGTEIAATYEPKSLKGFSLKGSLTYSKSEYEEFFVPLTLNRPQTATTVDQSGNLYGLELVGSGTKAGINIKGNQAAGRPPVIYNLNIGYNVENWGANFGGLTYSGGYSDALNLYKLPSISEYNLGVHYNFSLGTSKLRVSARIKNIFNGANARQVLAGGSNTDAGLIELQANPTQEGRLSTGILQNPRRGLITVTYTF